MKKIAFIMLYYAYDFQLYGAIIAVMIRFFKTLKMGRVINGEFCLLNF